jgi:hypothetical protein
MHIRVWCICLFNTPTEDGHMSDRNMYAVYGVYNTLSYTYVHLLVLLSYLITSAFF